MIKIATIANCQSSGITSLLRLACSQIEPIMVPPIHTIREEAHDEILKQIGRADVIVHQPIGSNFGPFGTEELRARHPSKRFVSFPSIYFSGILPHVCYLRLPGGGTLKGPAGDYHDLRILSGVLRGWSKERTESSMQHLSFDPKAWYARCFEESAQRDVSVDIPVMPIVQEMLQTEQTMFTFNHCDNKVLWHVAKRVLDDLGLEIDGIKTPPQRKYLGSVICGIPDDVPRSLGFQWRNPSYSIEGGIISNRDLVTAFYQAYEACCDISSILRYNRSRLGEQAGMFLPSSAIESRGL